MKVFPDYDCNILDFTRPPELSDLEFKTPECDLVFLPDTRGPETQLLYALNVCPINNCAVGKFVITSGLQGALLEEAALFACCGDLGPCSDTVPNGVGFNIVERTYAGVKIQVTNAVVVPNNRSQTNQTMRSSGIGGKLTPCIIQRTKLDPVDALSHLNRLFPTTAAASYANCAVAVSSIRSTLQNLHALIPSNLLSKYTELQVANECWAFNNGTLTSAGYTYITGDATPWYVNTAYAVPFNIIKYGKTVAQAGTGEGFASSLGSNKVYVHTNLEEGGNDRIGVDKLQSIICANINRGCEDLCIPTGTSGLLTFNSEIGCWEFTPFPGFNKCLVVYPWMDNEFPIKSTDDVVFTTAINGVYPTELPEEENEKCSLYRKGIIDGELFIIPKAGITADCSLEPFTACIKKNELEECVWDLRKVDAPSIGSTIKGVLGETHQFIPPGVYAPVIIETYPIDEVKVEDVENPGEFLTTDPLTPEEADNEDLVNLIPDDQLVLKEVLTYQRYKQLLELAPPEFVIEDFFDTSELSLPVAPEVIAAEEASPPKVRVYGKFLEPVYAGDAVEAIKISDPCGTSPMKTVAESDNVVISKEGWAIRKAGNRQTTMMTFKSGSGECGKQSVFTFNNLQNSTAGNVIARVDCGCTPGRSGFKHPGEVGIATLSEGKPYGWSVCKIEETNFTAKVVWNFISTDSRFDLASAPLDDAGYPLAIDIQKHKGVLCDESGTPILDEEDQPIEINVVWNKDVVLTKFGTTASYPVKQLNPDTEENLWWPVGDSETGTTAIGYKEATSAQQTKTADPVFPTTATDPPPEISVFNLPTPRATREDLYSDFAEGDLIENVVIGTIVDTTDTEIETDLGTADPPGKNKLLFSIHEKWTARKEDADQTDTNWLRGYIKEYKTSAKCEAGIVIPWPCKLKALDDFQDTGLPFPRFEDTIFTEDETLSVYAYIKEEEEEAP